MSIRARVTSLVKGFAVFDHVYQPVLEDFVTEELDGMFQKVATNQQQIKR